MGVQRLLANANNAVIAATPSASSIRAASHAVVRQQTARAGNGLVELTGDYTGANDAIIDVQILTTSGSTARVSEPDFSGAGTGTMTQPTATSGTASQDVTVTLVDLGTTTTAAQAILYADLLLRARTAGAGGNSITLAITPNLTLSADPVGALAEALARDAQEWSDQRLDFGAVPLDPDGALNAGCPRLVFSRDLSRVYRHYKRWDGEQWQYGVSPKLGTAYPLGALVHSVTGNYTVVVSDGVTTETVSGTTLYEVLLALSASALIEVVGVIANDRAPGGQAAIDLPVRTSAFALPATKSRDALPDLVDVAVAAIAPTEAVVLECLDNSAVNAEIWTVKSQVAGQLAHAVTGIAYDGPTVDFTIPQVPLTDDPVTGSLDIVNTTFTGVGDPKAYPTACLYRPLLGAAAVPKTLTLRWTARPSTDCVCTDMRVTGRPKPELLGINLGEDDMSALSAGHQSRLEALISWHKTFVAGNTAVSASGELRAADLDLQLAQLAVDELGDCLVNIYTDAYAVLQSPARANSTAYALYAVVEPATRNNYRYRCTVAGTSGSSAPTWPTTIGTTVTDGTVTWTCVSKIPEIAWDDVLSGLNTDLTSLATLGTEFPALTMTDLTSLTTAGGVTTAIYTTTAPTEGTTTITRLASDGQAHTYKCMQTEVATGSTAHRWSYPSHADGTIKSATILDSGGTIVGQVHWLDLGPAMAATADINASAGLPNDPGILRDPDTWVQRYRSACNHVRALAGLLPKADAGQTSSDGNDVWSDPGDPYYWEIQGTNYLPVFNGRYYHSCVRGCGTNEPVSTYEFGFALQIGCPENLVEGDTIAIAIAEVVGSRPYQVGDTYTIPVVQGRPLSFSGGVTGTDTLTWLVRSSTAGALADYPLTLAELPYLAGGLGFTIHRGSLDFALGDRFSFAVTAGERFQWRKDGGAWSAATAVADSVLLGDGLSAAFVAGVAPNFVPTDLYTFAVAQPHSPGHVQSAHDETWQWVGASATLTLTWGSDRTIAVVGLLRHGLTAPATVSIALKDAGGTPLKTLAPTVAAGPLVVVLATPLTTVRSMEIALANASGMSLGWVYAGVPLSTEHNAAITLRRAYALERDSGWNPRGAYLGQGRGGEIRWENWLLQSEFEALLALVDACKADGDAPLVVLPHVQYPAEAALVRVESDALEVSDVFDFQPNDTARRRLSLTLPLAAVLT